MDIDLLLKGAAIGFAIAAPVGPIGVLCIRRTLAEGRLAGFVSGLGAATADAIYSCIAGFGLTFLSGILINQQAWLHLIGGLFLCYLGIITFLAKPVERTALPKGDGGIARAYVSTFFLTLTNPMTILSFTAVFAGLGLSENFRSAVFRKRIDSRWLQWINRISGIIITGFGLKALFNLLIGNFQDFDFQMSMPYFTASPTIPISAFLRSNSSGV